MTHEIVLHRDRSVAERSECAARGTLRTWRIAMSSLLYRNGPHLLTVDRATCPRTTGVVDAMIRESMGTPAGETTWLAEKTILHEARNRQGPFTIEETKRGTVGFVFVACDGSDSVRMEPGQFSPIHQD
jgi:hypothetical protein